MPDRRLVIAVDVDETVADLFGVWLKRYNEDFNDNMTKDDLIEWEITSSIKPEARPFIMGYLADRELYKSIPPVEYARDSIKYLRTELGAHVVFASSCAYDSFQDKIDWLIEHDFIPTKDQGKARRYFIGIKDKSLIAADYLVDDKPENVNGFKGVGILFDQPFNRGAKLAPHVIRAKGWLEVLHIINGRFKLHA